jgi:hypothetical protein
MLNGTHLKSSALHGMFKDIPYTFLAIETFKEIFVGLSRTTIDITYSRHHVLVLTCPVV